MSKKMKIAIGTLIAYTAFGEYVGLRNYKIRKKLESENNELKDSQLKLVKTGLIQVAMISYLCETLHKHEIPFDEFDQIALTDLQNRFES
jgi:hypothetical protein